MNNYFKALNSWSLKWATTKWGTFALFLCAFADASFLPLSTPLFFMILTLLNVKDAFKNVFYATMGFFLGSILGYSIGHYAWLNTDGSFTRLAQFMFDHLPGFSETVYNNLFDQFEKWDFRILFVASFLPVPYKIFAISSGVFDINFYMFCITTLISQALKFYLMVLFILKVGPEVRKIFELSFKTRISMIGSYLAKVIVVLKYEWNNKGKKK